jgi:hypothetical protein
LLSPADYVLAALGVLLDAFALVCSIRSSSFKRYFALNLFLATNAVVAILNFATLRTYGFSSRQYFYFYFYGDALLTIFLFCVLISLYAHVFAELRVGKYVRGGAMLLLVCTALVSLKAVVGAEHGRMLTLFVVDLSQNLYFVGLVLAYVLWGAVMKLHETRTQLIQLVLSLGVYFSAFAAFYALTNLYPHNALWQYAPPLLTIFLPAAWAYTFSQVREDARLAVASVSGSAGMRDPVADHR